MDVYSISVSLADRVNWIFTRIVNVSIVFRVHIAYSRESQNSLDLLHKPTVTMYIVMGVSGSKNHWSKRWRLQGIVTLKRTQRNLLLQRKLHEDHWLGIWELEAFMFCDFSVENLSDSKSLLLYTIIQEFVIILCTDNMQ